MAAWANIHLTKSMLFYKFGLWEVFSQALKQGTFFFFFFLHPIHYLNYVNQVMTKWKFHTAFLYFVG